MLGALPLEARDEGDSSTKVRKKFRKLKPSAESKDKKADKPGDFDDVSTNDEEKMLLQKRKTLCTSSSNHVKKYLAAPFGKVRCVYGC